LPDALNIFANPCSVWRIWKDAMSAQHGDAATRWKQVRFWLGMLQMAGAVVAVTLLLFTGVTTASLLAVVFTSVATVISVLLFGSRRPPSTDRTP
jgi:hypothetical protein